MVEVEFIADFGAAKKGDKRNFDGMLASYLVHVDKVAKYIKEVKK